MMSENKPTILALDFDGVICDGLIEYFETAWRTYCQIWSPPSLIPPQDLPSRFYRLRPVIEVGWEMPILLQALMLEIPQEKMWQDWVGVSQQIVHQEGLQAAEIGAKLDNIRDEWIATDLKGWLSLHRFYPGVIEKLQQVLSSEVKFVIITTKEGRFVQQLLQEQNVKISPESIFGKEYQRPKHQLLRELIATSSDNSINVWFVEDRLKTLQSVEKQPDLEKVQLFLADWGYNTPAQQESVRSHPRIKLLSLSQFREDFRAWL